MDNIPVDTDELTLDPHQQAKKAAYQRWTQPKGKPLPIYHNQIASTTTMPKDIAPELNRKDRRHLAKLRRNAK